MDYNKKICKDMYRHPRFKSKANACLLEGIITNNSQLNIEEKLFTGGATKPIQEAYHIITSTL